MFIEGVILSHIMLSMREEVVRFFSKYYRLSEPMSMFASRCMKAVSMMMIQPKLAGIDLFPIRLTMSSNGDLGRV